MRYFFGLMLAIAASGTFPASAEEIAPGVSLASLESPASVGSGRTGDPDRTTALTKEGESESPAMVALIESNREDRERTVVIDR